MSPRSTVGWPEWEEENLLPWLDENQNLSWKALQDAYYEQYGVKRSPDSLRGKMYHILRKQGATVARPSEDAGRRKRPRAIRPRVESRHSRPKLPNKSAARSNIDRWFETILTTEPSSTNSSGSTKSKKSGSEHTTPVPTYSAPKENQSSAWMWEYVHRVCATGKLDF
ncbi:hypothetical protein N7523_002092 [Penicillium sp. IBT 18751x]|nr:hypothetical protein N7523_002092 [Penicillium sp. IBT 18751x]